jgi:hypothetical protein
VDDVPPKPSGAQQTHGEHVGGEGLCVQIVKKNETIWALFAEWTCHDQLKKLRAEEEELAKSKLGTVKGESDFEKKGDVGKKNWVLDGIRERGFEGAAIPPRQSSFHSKDQSQKDSMTIREWQECMDTLEPESLGLDECVQRLFV